jgi:hypothetical protein
LQDDKDSKFAKVLMSILHRQNKENRKTREQAKDIKNQMKKIGNVSSNGSPRRPNNTFVINIGGKKDKTAELPKEEREEKHDIPESNTRSIIELSEDEYKRIDDNEDENNFEGRYLE